jgi:hypothetical protein
VWMALGGRLQVQSPVPVKSISGLVGRLSEARCEPRGCGEVESPAFEVAEDIWLFSSEWGLAGSDAGW